MVQRELVLSDIDGTLVNDEHQLPAPVIAAVQAYSAAGGHFVLASARPALGMTAIADKLGIDLPLVTLNGALIVQTHRATNTFTTLFEQPLPAGVAARIYTLIHDHQLDISINVHVNTHWYIDAPEYWSNQEAAILDFQPETTDLHALVHSDRPVHKILCMAEPAVIAQLDALLKQEPDLNIAVSRSKLTYLEITAQGVSKQSALLHLADLLHVPVSNTMAIGDGENDLPMMQAAGLAVAMGNALPKVAAMIPTKVATNNDAGVAEALRKFAM